MQTQKSMKTAKGTNLPLIALKGKDYLQVMHRLVWFREEKPDWAIKTIIVERQEDFCMVRCEIYTSEGKLASTAHKVEHKAHFPDYIEKAETGSVGRALAMIGYGTQFAPELDEEDRIVDSPAPARNAPTAASTSSGPGASRRPIGPPPGKSAAPQTGGPARSGGTSVASTPSAPRGTRPPATTNGPTAPKTASPSENLAPQEDFSSFR